MQDIINLVIQEATVFAWVDWVVLVTAIIYVFLAARENVWCWFFGIISCSLWAYASFFYYNLYLDAGLQVFYVVISFVGIYQWKFGNAAKGALPITNMKGQEHLFVIIVGTLLSLAFGYFFARYTDAVATYLDAFTTVFSVLTTFLVIQKKLENWLYWIVIDIAYGYLYYSTGALLFAVVMVVYLGIAVQGYFNWKRKLNG